MKDPADQEPVWSARPAPEQPDLQDVKPTLPIIWVLLVMCVLPELVFLGADVGYWGDRTWRALGLQYGAFWPGLLDNWRPNYTGQPILMFLTYGFLHAGTWHMGLNMVTLVSLGRSLSTQVGQRQFLVLYIGSMIGGALAFTLFGPVSSPMVGASGALFGLAGALILDLWWDTHDWRLLVLPTGGLILLNVIMYYAMDGLLAWQTHLGGFLAGVWVMGMFLIHEGD